MNSELLSTLEYIEQERGISRDVLIEAIEKALMSASRKSIHPANEMEVKIDRTTGEIKAWAQLEVVESRPTADQILLSKAKERFHDVKVGSVIKWEVTPRNFGRIAAQTAKQTIMQQLRKAEKAIVREEFEDRIGQIVTGIVRRFDSGNIIVDMQKAEGIIPPKEKIVGESYMQGDRINALLLDVESAGSGPSLILSRANPDFIRRLFEREVSEIHDGIVEIKGIAREAGSRTKIAVFSSNPHVDPIGACVGMRGMRVKNITSELGGEKIDIVRYDDDIKVFVVNAMQPATLKSINIDEKNKLINALVSPDQLSLAIGKRGQNVRLTSKLLNWKVNIAEVKEEEKLSFEQKLEQTISSLSEILKIDAGTAEKLVNSGFTTIDGLKAAESSDLLEINGLTEKDVQTIMEAVKGMK